MGKVLIIGAGGVGTVVAHKVAQNPDVFTEIMIASRTKSKCDAIVKAIGNPNIRTAQVDADNVDELVALFNSFKPEIVINVALPYQDLTIMEACLKSGVNYLDTANYEPKDVAHFEYSWQWAYKKRFEDAGLTAILGCGFDPGVSGIYTAYAAKHYFDEMQYLDIVDCNAGNHHKAFATNFNPEINIREITADGATVATTKESAIKELGYLYDFQVALGGKEITESNLNSFEGAQGICPKGWHIPTRLEYFNLVGKTTNDADGKVPADGDKALFYDAVYDGAKISSLNNAGFNYQFSGVRMATSLTGAGSYQKTAIADDAKIQAAWHGKPAMNYLMTSTAYKPIYNSTSGLLTNIQFFGLMSTINATKYPEGRLSLSYVSIKAGMQVRCIRDQAGN